MTEQLWKKQVLCGVKIMIDHRINLLNRIGLTDAEARVYVALLQKGQLSGYEASKVSGVPRSKIYNALESLISKGFALFTEGKNSNNYISVPMEEVSEKIRHETESTLDELEEELKDCASKTDLEYIWHIREYSNVFTKCRKIVQDTKEELFLQIWEEDLPQIIDELKVLEEKNIRMGIIYYSNSKDSEVPLKKYYRHGLAKEKYEEMGGRWITLVSDSREVVFGQILNENTAEVIWTESNPMIFMAKEYVRHDIYFFKSAAILKDTMQKELGNDYNKVREIF